MTLLSRIDAYTEDRTLPDGPHAEVAVTIAVLEAN
jgi:hypothetical protein